ncbi:MAG: TDP-N-acetylfucosamine:lipid II N-acetylfucosaminyltransferase [Candidatus Woykebacteria bacterium]
MIKKVKPIIHIATDEKFIDAAHDIYEKAFPRLNEFLILLKKYEKEIKYLSKDNEYKFIPAGQDYLSEVIKAVRGAKIVVFHGMDARHAKVAVELNKLNVKLIWNVFGIEIYNNYKIVGNSSYGKLTYKEFVFSIKAWIKNKLRPLYYEYIIKDKRSNQLIIDAFKLMDYVSILYEEEIEKYIELEIVEPDIKFLKFTYYPLNIIINQNTDYTVGKNILIGNSATFTNNHIEVFEILSKFSLEERKAIVPLSYGNEDYANAIIERGASYLGENFNPLIDFLPLQEYQKILESCGIVIMNHYRQQAVGNVLNTLYMGSKVFLSEKNTLFHYLKRIGCTIYSIEKDLVLENKSVFELLSNKQQEENRIVLNNELRPEIIISELRNKLSEFLIS